MSKDTTEEIVRVPSALIEPMQVWIAGDEEALQVSPEQLRAYSRHLLQAVENERRALARELHDEAGQSLTALKLELYRLRREVDGPFDRRFEELEDLVDGVMENLQRVTMNLRPASLDQRGLVAALRSYVELYRRQTGMTVDLVTVGIEDRRLPAELETALYRVVQESLTNVARHAQASRVGIVLQRHNGHVRAIIEDDGRGFSVEEALRRGRLGLIGMRERAEILAGQLTIDSEPGKGTTLFFEVPARPLS